MVVYRGKGIQRWNPRPNEFLQEFAAPGPREGTDVMAGDSGCESSLSPWRLQNALQS